MSEQYYLFTMPGDMCPVWAEMYGPDGLHTVAPTPHSDMRTRSTRYPTCTLAPRSMSSATSATSKSAAGGRAPCR